MLRRSILLAAILAGFSSVPGRAQNFDAYCNRPDSAPALRQTVILLDEHDVRPEPGGEANPDNRPWRQYLGMLLLPTNPSLLEQNFAPRERVSIALVRKDGAGLRQIFTGCLPFFSPAERAKLAHDAGMMQQVHAFFGSGPAAGARRDMDMFRIQLGNAFKSALDPSALSAPSGRERNDAPASSSLAASLKQAKLFNPYYGLPRIVLFSDLTRLLRDMPVDRAGARKWGFDQGFQSDIDFGNAELYISGLRGSQNGSLRDGLEAFALASHAELAGMGPFASLPSFRAPPQRIYRFNGLIRYPDNRFPIRIRLALDENGSLVNSWLSVQTSREQFAPLHGILTCEANDACVYSGDQQFSQLWNPARNAGGQPAFGEALPFGGARSLNFQTRDGGLSGSISDTLVHFAGLKSLRLEFSGSAQPNARF
jgi:hypothetical protein